MDFNTDSELLACFDESGSGHPQKPLARKEVHKKPRVIWHAVVNIWVLNYEKSILCTKRSGKNEGNPNKWQTYVGGHVKYENDFEETAVKELEEELGLKLSQGKMIHIEKENYNPEKHMTIMYAFRWDGLASEVRPKDGEVDDAKWLSFDEYSKARKDDPEKWCNGLDPARYQRMLNKIYENPA